MSCVSGSSVSSLFEVSGISLHKNPGLRSSATLTGRSRQGRWHYPISMHACYPVRMQACYPLSMHACYPVRIQACYPLSMHACYPVRMQACYPVSMHACYPVRIQACYPLSMHACYPVRMQACYPVSMHAYYPLSMHAWWFLCLHVPFMFHAASMGIYFKRSQMWHGCMFKCTVGVVFKLFLLANQKPRNVWIRIPILLYFILWERQLTMATGQSVELNRTEYTRICNPFWMEHMGRVSVHLSLFII